MIPHLALPVGKSGIRLMNRKEKGGRSDTLGGPAVAPVPVGTTDLVHQSAEEATSALLAAVLIRTGARDRQAFEELYRLTSAKLFGICLRLCGSQTASEIVVHDVYLIIWKRAGDWEPDRQSPIIWLVNIARNCALDWRRDHATAHIIPTVANTRGSGAGAGSKLKAALANDTIGLNDCLVAICPEQREAIKAAYLDGLGYAELAQKAGVDVATMTTRIHEGLKRMRAGLEQTSE